MKNDLKSSCTSSDELLTYLIKKGNNHRKYKTYTRMKFAQSLFVEKAIFFSDGQNWNDTNDKEQMEGKCAFGKCFQYMMTENVANWMLYGGHGGKDGAMLDFPRKVIMNLKNSEKIQLGHFEKDESEEYRFKKDKDLYKKNGDFTIELIDILYVTPVEDGRKYQINRADEYATVDASVIEKFPILHKSYPWNYERECRMLIMVDEKHKEYIEENKITSARVELSEEDIKILKDCLYKSPVYESVKEIKISINPKYSQLEGEVSWDLGL